MQPTFFCSTPGCLDIPWSRGLCSKHYQQGRKDGTLAPTIRHSLSSVDNDARTAVCAICGPVRIRPAGPSRGAQCMTLRRQHREKGRRSPLQREQRRGAMLKWRYSLTLEAWGELLESQGGCCAICKTDDPGAGRQWCVDHDHACCPGAATCGTCVRGLLCQRCNVFLGSVRDDADFLRAAASYLESPPALARGVMGG